MIIDRQANLALAREARLYCVCNAETLEPIDPEFREIWYADDEAGIIRRYLRDENGETPWALLSAPGVPLTEEQIDRDHALYKDGITYLNPQLCLAWREERRPIRIIRIVGKAGVSHDHRLQG